MTNKLNSKNYIAIADWMLDLKLNTRELLLYALIYGFSQEEEDSESEKNYCYASYEYIANWLDIESSQNVSRYIKPLVDKGLIKRVATRNQYGQKVYKYKALIKKGRVVGNPDIDYIIIQPWMITNMHLNGKNLLLYAVVHSYSRTGSGNYCIYNKNYFAKWLQVRKDNVDRQIKQAEKEGLIKSVKDGYEAIVPKDIQLPQSESFRNNTLTQTESFNPQSESFNSLKLRDNNLYINNLNNNLNVVIVKHNKKDSDFDIERFQKSPQIQNDMSRIIEAYGSERGLVVLNDIFDLIIKTIDNWGFVNIKKINKLSNEQNYKIYKKAKDLIEDDVSSETKLKLISTQISKFLKS